MPARNSNPACGAIQQIKDSLLCPPGLWRWVSLQATGHYALSGGRLRPPSTGTGSVLCACRAHCAAAARRVLIGDTPKRQIRAEAARRVEVPTEAGHDICFLRPGTPGFLGERIGVRRGVVVDAMVWCWLPRDGVRGLSGGVEAWASPGRARMVVRAMSQRWYADTATVHVVT